MMKKYVILQKLSPRIVVLILQVSYSYENIQKYTNIPQHTF